MSDCSQQAWHVPAEREPGVLYMHGHPGTDYAAVTAIEVDGQRFERADDLVNLASHAWSMVCCAIKGVGISADWSNCVRQGLRDHGIDPEKIYQAVSADD